MRFWQEAAVAASSKFVETNFAADEDLANVGGGDEIHSTFLPSRLRMENFFDEVDFSGLAGLVNWQGRSEAL